MYNISSLQNYLHETDSPSHHHSCLGYNTERFNRSIVDKVLPLWNPFRARHFILVMNNASIQRSPPRNV